MPSPAYLAFGIELELSLVSSKKVSSWSSMAKDISHRLSKKGVSNQVTENPDHAYQVWSIVQEITIPSLPAKNKWGVELVSPIFTLDSSWLTDLEVIFSEIRKVYKIQTSSQCSTHIHVSQLGHDMSPHQLAALAQAALVYEPCLDILVPGERSTAYWCRSNRQNPFLAIMHSLSHCLDQLEVASAQEDGVGAIVESMCLFPASSPYGRAHGLKKDFIHGKVYKWNLARLLSPDAEARTVEYRQPAGSTCAEDAMGWALLTLCFIVGSFESRSGSASSLDDVTLWAEFWEHLCRGADALNLDTFMLDYLRSFLDMRAKK
ncbi:hypothetical protein BN1708_002757 [Verticillium longisporum]|uniref:Amidoligase enzyme n=1 Tax=Verticillium longisporum TaxID=100787 RepID=A0A0G4L0I6_VERLO|nr:hypothetical protein HYQ44_017978 [Verticillium longisporum]CRK15517.1 hypothetical protein BN1708_002757 [Verticillium longisporum]